MKNRKVWRLAGTLEEKEKAHFLRFLAAELQDRQQYLQQLALLIMDTHPESLSDEEAWEVLYPSKVYDDGRLRKLLRDLCSWLEEYLSIQGFRKNSAYKDLFYLRELEDRNSYEDFVKTYNKQEKRWSRNFTHISLTEQFYIKFLREIDKQNFISKNRLNPDLLKGFASHSDQGSKEHYLLDSVRAFTHYYMAQSMALGLDGSLEKLDVEEEIFKLFQQNLQLLRNFEGSSDIPQLQLFLSLFGGGKEEQFDSYLEVFGKLKNKDILLSKYDLRLVFAVLFNFFIRERARRGDQKIIPLLLDISNWAIREKFILNDGILDSYHYRNTINLCLRIRKFSQAEDYLERLKPLLNKNEQEDAYALSRATILTAKEDFKSLIKFLSDKRFKNERYEIDARIKLLQANYELDPNSTIWLETQIGNLQKYIRGRKAISKNLRDQHLVSLRYFRQLVLTNSSKKAKRVQDKLVVSPPFAIKGWILNNLKRKSSH